MPLTMKYSETYNDALIALAAATHRPANVVNLFGEYAIRVDLEYNRFLLATNTAAGLSDRPDNGESCWCGSSNPRTPTLRIASSRKRRINGWSMLWTPRSNRSQRQGTKSPPTRTSATLPAPKLHPERHRLEQHH